MKERKKILVFDIFADYAQFKKYFSNMSPLTFAIPPRTVVSGILGAVVGIDKKNNPEHFSNNNSFIALKINNSIRKIKLPTNYLKTTSKNHFSKFDEHKPTNVEYLKNPSFRIYVSHTDRIIYEKLKNNLKQHKSFFTLNLGISSCLANFVFFGEFDAELFMRSEVYIDSIIPKNEIKEIGFDNNIMIQQNTMPNIMLNDREVTEYKEFIYEINGNKIKTFVKKYYHISETGENIIGM